MTRINTLFNEMPVDYPAYPYLLFSHFGVSFSGVHQPFS
jgi:hypothetical protein